MPSTMARKPCQANPAIRAYYEAQSHQEAATAQTWLLKPQIPSGDEVLGLYPEKVEGKATQQKFDSKSKYLDTHYSLLREDQLRPLKSAVQIFRQTPSVYQNVYIIGYTLTDNGIAARICFSTRRAGKNIRWELSERLKQGSLLALSPVDDMFRSTCTTAIVAGGSLEALEETPPKIDIFFSHAKSIQFDPQKQWVMLEARDGYWEACRSTLLGLQTMAFEVSPLDKIFVHLDKNVKNPTFCTPKPASQESFSPARLALTTSLDSSQLKAINGIQSEELCIIQGPPGTGKTHVSVVGLRIMLESMQSQDLPIIVATKTNHALDQLLSRISEFEPSFIRLGTRSQDELIQRRTLKAVKKLSQHKTKVVVGGAFNQSRGGLRHAVTESKSILAPFVDLKGLIPALTFQTFGLLSDAQVRSLTARGDWVGVDGRVEWNLETWLEGQVRPYIRSFSQVNPIADYEEIGPKFEEAIDQDEDRIEALREKATRQSLKGAFVAIHEPVTMAMSRILDPEKAQRLLKEQDLWKINPRHRGIIYDYLAAETKKAIQDRLRQAAVHFNEAANLTQISRAEKKEIILRGTRIIGATTTGIAMNRALISSLRPRVLIVEEAAESFEGDVLVSCVESIQQLVLVGDHKQLQPMCATPQYGKPPYNLNVSMFERFVSNNIQAHVLTTQRRMRPEFRKLLIPIYGNLLLDHSTVKDRAHVPGMGGINCFFFSHEWREESDPLGSRRNFEEARFLVGHFEYLFLCGVHCDKITIITVYNGQRKAIANLLRNSTVLPKDIHYNTETIDSYQGEENEIILLSLVCSGVPGQLGNLYDDHRISVALSRARNGFYVYGNLAHVGKSCVRWQQVLDIAASLYENRKAIGSAVPIHCQLHNVTKNIRVKRRLNGTSSAADVMKPAWCPWAADTPARKHATFELRLNIKLKQKAEVMSNTKSIKTPARQRFNETYAIPGPSTETNMEPMAIPAQTGPLIPGLEEFVQNILDGEASSRRASDAFNQTSHCLLTDLGPEPQNYSPGSEAQPHGHSQELDPPFLPSAWDKLKSDESDSSDGFSLDFKDEEDMPKIVPGLDDRPVHINPSPMHLLDEPLDDLEFLTWGKAIESVNGSNGTIGIKADVSAEADVEREELSVGILIQL
ncbi:MAG: hypothetical protein M1814_001919 [Vezdaea aestivalis]|nr:MAG: hypothetical protein M1814_001919 [Vezdaea aestivalis]